MRWHLLLASTAVAATLAFPVGAAASSPGSIPIWRLGSWSGQPAARESSRSPSRPPSESSFELKTRDGYEVTVYGVSNAGSVYVDVSNNGYRSATAYVVHGTATSTRVQADFGRFGEVAMKFRPDPGRPWAEANRVCRGKKRFVKRTGTFVGRFRFRGEGGYFSTAVKRARGSVTTVAAKCRRHRGAGRSRLSFHPSQNSIWGPELPFVMSRWRVGTSSAQFVAVGGKHPVFYAATEESLGTVARFHFAYLRKKIAAKDIRVGKALTFARVSPPPPFHGTATYRAAADGTRSWTGSLSVDFPGAAGYPLTGPLFKPVIGFSNELIF